MRDEQSESTAHNLSDQEALFHFAGSTTPVVSSGLNPAGSNSIPHPFESRRHGGPAAQRVGQCNDSRSDAVSRRELLVGSAITGVLSVAGCLERTGPATESTTAVVEAPTVFVFNTGEGTVSLIDATEPRVLETRSIGTTASFPANQYAPSLTDTASAPLWLNAGRGVRGHAVGTFERIANIDTGSGANWQELTPDGRHLLVSAREPAHHQLLVDADRASDTFGSVRASLDRSAEGGRGDATGPGPCDVTIHPNGDYAYVPDLFGDTLTVLRIEPFEIASQVAVERQNGEPATPWMATVAPDGETLLVEHRSGIETVWDVTTPAQPRERARLTPDDGVGQRPLTSEITADSATGYVFTPGSNDVTVIDLDDDVVSGRIDLGGAAFVGSWTPSASALYAPIQTTDEVAVIEPPAESVSERLAVGSAPYGATASRVRPAESAKAIGRLANMGVVDGDFETSYCIGNCACGHQL